MLLPTFDTQHHLGFLATADAAQTLVNQLKTPAPPAVYTKPESLFKMSSDAPNILLCLDQPLYTLKSSELSTRQTQSPASFLAHCAHGYPSMKQAEIARRHPQPLLDAHHWPGSLIHIHAAAVVPTPRETLQGHPSAIRGGLTYHRCPVVWFPNQLLLQFNGTDVRFPTTPVMRNPILGSCPGTISAEGHDADATAGTLATGVGIPPPLSVARPVLPPVDAPLPQVTLESLHSHTSDIAQAAGLSIGLFCQSRTRLPRVPRLPSGLRLPSSEDSCASLGFSDFVSRSVTAALRSGCWSADSP